jgi:hypothetical protein
MTLENVEFKITSHNRTLLQFGFWSLIPFDWGMKHFMKNEETSQAVRFFQYKTGKSVFAPECWSQWRRMQQSYC